MEGKNELLSIRQQPITRLIINRQEKQDIKELSLEINYKPTKEWQYSSWRYIQHNTPFIDFKVSDKPTDP